MKGRRLAYLCLETPREGQAVHTHVHEIVNELRSIGWTVELFATSQGGVSAGASYAARLKDYSLVQRTLFRRLSEFDAIYSRSHFAALPLSLAAARKGMLVFQEVNGKPTDIGVTYPWLKPLVGLVASSYRRQLEVATHVFAVTPGLKAWAEGEARHDRITLVPNAANTNVFQPEGPRIAVPYQYVVFVGGLAAWHGISTMLAAAESPHWPSGIRLVMIGDGVERKVVAAAAARGSVVWLGRRPYREVAEHVRGAIAALCVIDDPDGRSETGVAPLKLYEALASGVPVIVSDLPYQAEIVQSHDLGLVVPMKDPHALAIAVARLVAHPAQAKDMGRRGACYARSHGSWQVRAAEIGRTMAEAIDQNPDRTGSQIAT